MNTADIIFATNCYISGGLSISLSSILFYAILTRTPTEWKNYRIFLLNINISDILVSFLMTLLQWIPGSSKHEIDARPSNDSGVSYVIKGPAVFFIHPHWGHFLTCVFCGVFLYNIMALPTSFAFRYITLAYPRFVHIFLNKLILIPFFIFLLLLSFSTTIIMFWGDLVGALPGVFVFGFEGNWSMFYFHYDSTYEPSFGNLIHMTNFVINAFYILGICIFVSYVVIIFSWAQILRLLHQNKAHMSQKTLALQRSLVISLTCQSCLPIFFVGVPLLYVVISIWTNSCTEESNSVAMLVFSYQTVLSPIFSFIFLKPYRSVFICLRQKEMSTVGGKTTENVTRRPSIQPPAKDNGQIFERRNTVTVS